jgi:hypothetical protein
MLLRIVSSAFVALSVVLLLGSTAKAQFPPRNRNQVMQQPQRIKISGTLVAVAQNQVQLTTNTNQTIYVMIVPETEVSVTGTAEQDYLKSGVAVELVADVAKGGAVKEQIKRLTVFSPTADRAVGLFPPDFSIPDKKDDNGAKAGALPPGLPPDNAPPGKPRKRGNTDGDPQGGDLFNSKPSKGQNSVMRPPGTFTVRGTIKTCKNNAIRLAAGRTAISGELSNDVSIDVDMSDIRIAQRDDKITVNGITNQARPNMVMAQAIKVELAAPLSGAKKHTTRPAKTPAVKASKPKKDATESDDLLGK